MLITLLYDQKKVFYYSDDLSQTLCSYLSRVFLRAINQYAAVLNKKFLDQTNFELQVRAEPSEPYLMFFQSRSVVLAAAVLNI